MKKIFFATLLLFVTLSPMLVLADGLTGTDDGSSVKLPNALGEGVTIGSLFEKATNLLTIAVSAIAGLMIIVGAFQIILAAGDPGKFKKGKDIITYAVIGFIVFLLANLIVNVITELVGANAN